MQIEGIQETDDPSVVEMNEKGLMRGNVCNCLVHRQE